MSGGAAEARSKGGNVVVGKIEGLDLEGVRMAAWETDHTEGAENTDWTDNVT